MRRFVTNFISKKLKYLFIGFLFTGIVFNVAAKGVDKEKPSVTINFTFTGIVDSCNYINRIQVFVDGAKVVTSSEKKQNEPNSVTFTVKKGNYKIKVIDEILFQGTWEEQTIANNYNIDAVYESNIQIKGNITLNLLFDLDKGVSLVL